jgi:hypothetical protein
MFDNRKVLSTVLAASMSTMLIPSAAFAEAATDLGQDTAIETLDNDPAENSGGGGLIQRIKLSLIQIAKVAKAALSPAPTL